MQGAEAQKIIDNELDLARKTETELWGKIDKNVNATTTNTMRVFKDMQDELLDVEKYLESRARIGYPICSNVKKKAKLQTKKEDLRQWLNDLDSSNLSIQAKNCFVQEAEH